MVMDHRYVAASSGKGTRGRRQKRGQVRPAQPWCGYLTPWMRLEDTHITQFFVQASRLISTLRAVSTGCIRICDSVASGTTCQNESDNFKTRNPEQQAWLAL